MAKRLANVEKDRCVACGACANECPRNAAAIWKGCYAVVDESLCAGCGRCANICPVGCIGMKTKEGFDEKALV